MALREDDSQDPKRRATLGEQIRMWAGTLAKIAVVVVPVFAGLHYMINAEIAPVKQQIVNVEVRLNKLDKTVEKEIGRVEARVDQLDGKLDRFIEAMADFRVEVLTWMARIESSRQTSSSQRDGGREGHSDASSLPVDSSAPTVPVAVPVGARDGHRC